MNGFNIIKVLSLPLKKQKRRNWQSDKGSLTSIATVLDSIVYSTSIEMDSLKNTKLVDAFESDGSDL